jgi:hypothetical protein
MILLCGIKIYKISEKIMGDRVTKTEHFIKSVKAQRVDGSLYLIKKYIRFTLMGFEKSYHISNPSKQLNLN